MAEGRLNPVSGPSLLETPPCRARWPDEVSGLGSSGTGPHGQGQCIKISWAPWPRHHVSSVGIHLGSCQGRANLLAPYLLSQPFGNSAGAVRLDWCTASTSEDS